MDGIRQLLRGLPVPLRFAVAGTASLGLLGAAVGLFIGLDAYPPTAWAAMVELGLPAAAVGAALGALVGSLVSTRRRGHAR